MKREKLCRIGVYLLIAVFLVYFVTRPTLSSDPTRHQILDTIVTRGIAGLVFLLVLLPLGYPILRPFRGGVKGYLLCLPFLAVTVNNLPILPLLRGTASVECTKTDFLLFTLSCLLIGFFEEMTFRGVIFMMLLEKRPKNAKNLFLATVLASAVFGVCHLVNLLEGAGIGPTLMQIGYSFLIGGMCSIALVLTRDLWTCVLLHSVFDFCGKLVPTLGQGEIWDAPTITITAILAVLVTAYAVWTVAAMKPEPIEKLFSDED